MLTATDTVLTRPFGDVNLNSSIDTADAVLALKHASHFESLTDPDAPDMADYNGDGRISTGDARWILYDIVHTKS